MGLRDIKEDGFRWSADQTLPQYKPWYNWGPRDPKRNCGLLYFRDNIWLDHYCSTTYNYVCEVISVSIGCFIKQRIKHFFFLF